MKESLQLEHYNFLLNFESLHYSARLIIHVIMHGASDNKMCVSRSFSSHDLSSFQENIISYSLFHYIILAAKASCSTANPHCLPLKMLIPIKKEDKFRLFSSQYRLAFRARPTCMNRLQRSRRITEQKRREPRFGMVFVPVQNLSGSHKQKIKKPRLVL